MLFFYPPPQYFTANGQSTQQSGNINDCLVWPSGIDVLQNTTISSGHTVMNNISSTLSSVTLEGNSSILNLDAGKSITFSTPYGGNTSVSTCKSIITSQNFNGNSWLIIGNSLSIPSRPHTLTDWVTSGSYVIRIDPVIDVGAGNPTDIITGNCLDCDVWPISATCSTPRNNVIFDFYIRQDRVGEIGGPYTLELYSGKNAGTFQVGVTIASGSSYQFHITTNPYIKDISKVVCSDGVTFSSKMSIACRFLIVQNMYITPRYF